MAWTVHRGESYKVFCANKKRSDYRCLWGGSCPFRVYISEESKDGVFIVRTVQHHTCPPVTHVSFKRKNSMIADELTIKPRILQTIERREQANNGNYLAMARCQSQVNRRLEGDDKTQVKLIQPFLNAISPSTQRSPTRVSRSWRIPYFSG